MNRERAITVWTIVLLVLEFAFLAFQMQGFPEGSILAVFRQWSPLAFVVLLIAFCSVAQMLAKAGWIVLLRSLWMAFLLLWVAFPLLRIWFPDLTDEGSLLPDFMFIYGGAAFVATSAYMLVVPSFFSSSLDDLWKWIPVFDLSPSQGKTVRELEEGVNHPPRKLLFGEADRELVSHWRKIGQTMLVVSARRKKLVGMILLCLIAWPVLVYFAGGGAQGAFERDVARLWEVQPDESNAKAVVATRGAMNAARRLFRDELAFRGLTRLEARKLLGIERKDERYLLDKPEFSWQSDQLVLRMSDGHKSIDLLAGYGDDDRIRITSRRESNAPSRVEAGNGKTPESVDSGVEIH